MMGSRRLYQVMVYGVIGFFLAIMLVAVVVANTRKSGNTGLDAAKMQISRIEVNRAHLSPKPHRS